jgi:uncharacterized membrane protein YjjB (DUF3815 family)
MYSLSTLVAIAFISFVIGFISHLFLNRNGVVFEKRIAVLILTSWLSFAMLAYLQDKELSLFFNAAGMGAVGNLLGIKTSELFSSFFNRK